MDRAILPLDVPAFPIAVERVVTPYLRDRPVVVAPSSSTRAPVLVSSLEARRAGGFRGMPLARASTVCRAPTGLPPHESPTPPASRPLLKILLSYSPLSAP